MKTDEQLRTDVMEEINWDPQLTKIATEIGVASKDGVITLTGEVDSYWKKRAAEDAAQRVAGVKVVACDIEVKLSNWGKYSDSEVGDAIRNALRWNSAINDDQIEVKVDKGWVTLDGSVDYPFQKKYAQSYIEDLMGVAGVTNNITIRHQSIDIKDIQRKITAAYHRSANIDAHAINVQTSGNKVTLTGTVRSWAEKREAEKVALSAPGVYTIDNKIEIDLPVLV